MPKPVENFYEFDSNCSQLLGIKISTSWENALEEGRLAVHFKHCDQRRRCREGDMKASARRWRPMEKQSGEPWAWRRSKMERHRRHTLLSHRWAQGGWLTFTARRHGCAGKQCGVRWPAPGCGGWFQPCFFLPLPVRKHAAQLTAQEH